MAGHGHSLVSASPSRCVSYGHSAGSVGVWLVVEFGQWIVRNAMLLILRRMVSAAHEVHAAFEVAAALGHVAEEDVKHGIELLERVKSMLWRMTH